MGSVGSMEGGCVGAMVAGVEDLLSGRAHARRAARDLSPARGAAAATARAFVVAAASMHAQVGRQLTQHAHACRWARPSRSKHINHAATINHALVEEDQWITLGCFDVCL